VDTQLPSNVDKGVRELRTRGYPITSVYPWPAQWRPKSQAARRARYLAATPALLAAARPADSIIYTADLPWIRIIAALRHAHLLDRRVVAHWGGIDFEPKRLATDPAYRRGYERLFSAIDVIWMASEYERRIWSDALPHLADRMAFRPMFLDLDYYRRIKPADQAFDVLAIGSDARRDWDVPLHLAARGLKTAIVTEDERVRARIEALPANVRQNVFLAFRTGFEQSAQLAAAARCILVATTPNFRFSGSTTVAVAAALGRPLLIDEPYDLGAYGITPGKHCEAFQRGDGDAAFAAAQKVLDHPEHAKALSAAIAALGQSMSIADYVNALERSFSPVWQVSVTRPFAADVAPVAAALPPAV
jgi:hypothetical protein